MAISQCSCLEADERPCRRLFESLYGDSASQVNRVAASAELLSSRRHGCVPLEMFFYNPWNAHVRQKISSVCTYDKDLNIGKDEELHD
jgi:hypothetical protein